MITSDRSFLFMTMKGKLMKTKTKEITPMNTRLMKTTVRGALAIIMNTSPAPSSNRQITDPAGINKTGRTRLAAIFRWPLLLALLVLPQMVQAQWTATVGAHTDDKGIQVLAFLPTEIWIHSGAI